MRINIRNITKRVICAAAILDFELGDVRRRPTLQHKIGPLGSISKTQKCGLLKMNVFHSYAEVFIPLCCELGQRKLSALTGSKRIIQGSPVFKCNALTIKCITIVNMLLETRPN